MILRRHKSYLFLTRFASEVGVCSPFLLTLATQCHHAWGAAVCSLLSPKMHCAACDPVFEALGAAVASHLGYKVSFHASA